MTAPAISPKVFGPEDWVKYCGKYGITEAAVKDLTNFSVVPLKRPLYSSCKIFPDRLNVETHFYFVGLSFFGGDPFTIMKWHTLLEKNDDHPLFHFVSPIWYADGSFATRTTCERNVWYATIAPPVPDTEHMSIAEFKDSYTGYAPTTVEIVTMQILHYLKYGCYISDSIGFRSSEMTREGRCVAVQSSIKYGIYISSYEMPETTSSGKTRAMGVPIP